MSKFTTRLRAGFRRMFPRFPALGLTLIVLIVVEAGAICDSLIEREQHAVEGTWTSAEYTMVDGVKHCNYTRSRDRCQGNMQPIPWFGPDGNPIEIELPDPTHDCWEKDISIGGHRSSGYNIVSTSDNCDATVSSPANPTGPVDQAHRYTVTR